ncbi:telomere binding protein [Actinomortierella ambigua]|uniref:Telomere binding protein n=1 Tax=Actinomortierella ambigua TaxID=1343610 RepID=A0A9P6U7K1_9FUNG|nr:telomere binding protein [Actinomortierella ambigua]
MTTRSGDHASLTNEHNSIAAHVKQLHDLLLHAPQPAGVGTVARVLSEPLSFLGLETGGASWTGPMPTIDGRLYLIQYLLPHHINFILDHIVLDWLSALPTTVQTSCFEAYFVPPASKDAPGVPGESSTEIIGCVHLMAVQTLVERLTSRDFSSSHSFVNSTILRLLRINVSSISLLSRWRAVSTLYSRGGNHTNDGRHMASSQLMPYWQDFVTRLYSIPVRVANVLGQDFASIPEDFQDRVFYERQAKFIAEAVGQTRKLHPIEPLVTQVLASATSKLAILGQTNVLAETMLATTMDPIRGFIGDRDAMAAWKEIFGLCSIKTLSSLLASILARLQHSALTFATDTDQLWCVQQHASMLHRIGYGPDSPLGSAVVEDTLSFGKVYNTSAVRTLVCLQSGWPDQVECDGVLAKSFKRALSIWSDSHFVRNSVPEYQRYILEQMLVIVGYLGAKILDEEGTEAIFWSGMPEWLNLTDFSRRKLGLVLAEEVSKVVIKTGKPVDFELDDADPEIRFLRSLVRLRDGQQPAATPFVSGHDVVGDNSSSSHATVRPPSPTETMAHSTAMDEDIDEEDPDAPVEQFSRMDTPYSSKHQRIVGLHGNFSDEDEAEGEDDDDLKPYAMDEESDPDEELGSLRKSKVNPPIYLRDLNLYLRASEDREKAEVGLLAAADLIRKKAESLELNEYAERLTVTLVTLQDSFDLPKFTELREKALVALVITLPPVVVRMLSAEFYEKGLSFGQRLTILSALSIGAQELSGRNVLSETGLATPFAQGQQAERSSPLSKAATATGTPASDATMPPLSMESIQTAIALTQTRRFSQKSAVEARRLPPKINPFSKLAPVFIGDLLGRWGGNRGPGAEQGYDVIRKSPLVLLDRFVATLGVFVYFGGNSSSLIAMTRELFRFLLALRYYVPTAAQMATLPSAGLQQAKVTPPRPLTSGKGSLMDDQFGTIYNRTNLSSSPSSILQLGQDGSAAGATISEAGSRMHALQTISSSNNARSSSQGTAQPGVPGSQLSPGLVQTILFDMLILMNPPPGSLSDELFVVEFGQDLAETQAWAAELWERPLDGEEKTRIYTAAVLQRCHELQQKFMR